MAISSLKTVISGSFITALNKKAGGSTPAIGQKKGSGETIDVTLRSTARNLAVGVQSLNLGISFVNISRDVNSKLLSVVDKLEVLVSKAGKGGLSGATANTIREEFASLAGKFQDGIKNAKVEGRDVLDADSLKQVLAQSGLKAEEVEELGDAFKQMTSVSKTIVNEDGTTTTTNELLPVDQFTAAMRKAGVAAQSDEPAESELDISVLFRSVRDKLRGVGDKLRKNIDALDKTTEVLKKNIDLVRATGFAFLDASSSVKGNEDPEKIAEQIRQKVQAAAPNTLSQSHNLQAIMVAGLSLAQQQLGKSGK